MKCSIVSPGQYISFTFVYSLEKKDLHQFFRSKRNDFNNDVEKMEE